MKNAVLYARYSSANQTEQSIEGQTHVCEKYAAQNDIQIVRHYIDTVLQADEGCDFPYLQEKEIRK